MSDSRVVTKRHRVREIFSKKIDGADQIDLPVVTREVMAEVRADPELHDAYVDELLYETLYREGMTVIQSRRISARQAEDLLDAIAQPSPAVNHLQRLLDRESRAQRDLLKRWLTHTEYVGTRHVLLMALTHEQIPEALAARRARQQAEEPYIQLLAALEQRTAPGQCVADVFSAQQIQKLFEELQVVQPASPIAASVTIPGETR